MLSGGAALTAEPPREAETAAPAPLSVQILDARDIPRDWQRAWDRLAPEASEPNVFAERWFVGAGIRHLLPDGPAWMIGVWRGGSDLVGLLPVRIERRYGRTPVAHVQNWMHHQSFLGTPLIRAGKEAAFWAEVLEALDAAPWARGFFHMTELVEDGPVHRGLVEAAAALGRPCPVVHRSRRAFLQSGLPPKAYYEQAVRKKKRKELRRLSARLRELGTVAASRPASAEEAARCCDEFLALEAAGWKGRAGSALASDPAKEAFFRDVIAGAQAAGRLEFLRFALDDRPIAILVNFFAPPGGFTFKIAFDEEFARFSPGVLIQIENLRVLERPDVAWMDSCAVENHPMIDSLWTERRSIVRVTLPLAGRRRSALFAVARALETGSALLRRLFTSTKAEA
ncbi:MAG TPA: GNAT family N-acetyltransferase [Allosphingosinicella sp.]|jgi:CelD/BcsL family acetyltransferase involved in cellulose biosynthesis|nr:GNAT family N-acetyltransferase [Allosphingosinicella sp.]